MENPAHSPTATSGEGAAGLAGLHEDHRSAGPCRFQETRWSLVHRVAGGGREGSEALSELCRLAWFPLFSYARRLGWEAEDAEDAVQDFLSGACDKGLFALVEKERGKLRTYLLTAFDRALKNKYRHRNAARRGGGATVLSLDLAGVEAQFARECRETETPDRLYHRQWAIQLLEAALEAVEREYTETGRGRIFEVLSEGLEGEGPAGGYAAAGLALGLRENAARQAMHRLRLAFRRELRRCVALSLGSSDPVGITSDLEALREALAGD